jgi:hypothetical protein
MIGESEATLRPGGRHHRGIDTKLKEFDMPQITAAAAALIASLLTLAVPSLASAADMTPATALAATAGEWRGELQYRDYQSDRWEGLPMTVAVVAQPDGVTTLRTAQFDDGPKAGMVTITTATIVDPARGTAGYAMLRKGRAVDAGEARVTSFMPGADAAHWTLVTQERRQDGDGIAQVRETTVRDGDTLTTTKDVDPEGDGKTGWLPRNRTVLKRVG